MSFVSQIEFQVIDDDNWQDFVQPLGDESSASGFIPRDYDAQPFGSVEGAHSFPAELMIPREEWKERIEEMERTRTRLSDLLKQHRIWLNQARTNYCWAYGVVHAVMAIRVVMGQPAKRLSPASVAAPIKGYRNVGGWGSQALSYIIKNGVADESVWPQNAIDPRYFAASRENAAQNKVTEWWELRPRSFAEKMSCLLRRWPVASGYNWMGHEMMSCDPLILPNGGIGVLDLNSYTRDGSFDGYTLSESRATADDQVVPRVPTAS